MYLAAKTTCISRSLFSLLVILAAASIVKADVYMALGDVPGAATDSKHRSWIKCESAQFAVKRPESSPDGKGASSGAPKLSAITLIRSMDVSSPELFIRAANGQLASEAVIEFTNSTGAVYLRIVLRDVAVTGYSISASHEAITEEIKVTYSEIGLTYIVNDGSRDGGSFSRTWSVSQNIEL